jgi:hypothetical protein
MRIESEAPRWRLHRVHAARIMRRRTARAHVRTQRGIKRRRAVHDGRYVKVYITK